MSISCCAECPNDTERITKNTKNLEAREENMYIQQQQRTYEKKNSDAKLDSEEQRVGGSLQPGIPVLLFELHGMHLLVAAAPTVRTKKCMSQSVKMSMCTESFFVPIVNWNKTSIAGPFPKPVEHIFRNKGRSRIRMEQGVVKWTIVHVVITGTLRKP